jgi:hypothetical protein
VGDFIVLENRDLLAHMISITGPQPLPDVVLERGTTIEVGPLLTPGAYRLVSNRNVVNTSFAVEFAFACAVHASEPHSMPTGPLGGAGVGGSVSSWMEAHRNVMTVPLWGMLGATFFIVLVALVVRGLVALTKPSTTLHAGHNLA